LIVFNEKNHYLYFICTISVIAGSITQMQFTTAAAIAATVVMVILDRPQRTFWCGHSLFLIGFMLRFFDLGSTSCW
jgi:hypothetical protein